MVEATFKKILEGNLRAQALLWLENSINTIANRTSFYSSFLLTPRKVGKNIVYVTDSQMGMISQLMPEFSLTGWTVDRLCRVYLLLNLPSNNKEDYFKTVEELYKSAELNELVALYSALPMLQHPDLWTKRCAEGIRSNMAPVLEAIMYHNPYPYKQLDDGAWNQMILKAFFTEKDVARIVGFEKRNNQELVLTLTDYIHERQAAKRNLNPQLWLLVGAYANETLLNDFDQVLKDHDEDAKQCLAKGILKSGFEPAINLLKSYELAV